MIETMPVRKASTGRIWIKGTDYSAVIAGTWNNVATATGCLGILENSTHSNGDEVNFKAYFANGTYSGSAGGLKHPQSGIVNVYIGTTKVHTWDMYDPAGVNGVTSLMSSFNITTPGIYTIRWVLNGKNAASANYYGYLHYISFWRTA
jgi:hypothetical protein